LIFDIRPCPTLRFLARGSRLLPLDGLGLLGAGVAAGGELVLEFLDPARRVDVLELAGEERVASRANIDLQLLPRAAGGEAVAATARDGRGDVGGVYAFFHDGDPAAKAAAKRSAGRGSALALLV